MGVTLNLERLFWIFTLHNVPRRESCAAARPRCRQTARPVGPLCVPLRGSTVARVTAVGPGRHAAAGLSLTAEKRAPVPLRVLNRLTDAIPWPQQRPQLHRLRHLGDCEARWLGRKETRGDKEEKIVG